MIEINGNKNDNIKYLEIDDKLYDNYPEMRYDKESIYIIQSNNLKDFGVSFGAVKNINKSNLIFSGHIKSNSKDSLIFNSSNNKLICIKGNKSYLIMKVYF